MARRDRWLPSRRGAGRGESAADGYVAGGGFEDGQYGDGQYGDGQYLDRDLADRHYADDRYEVGRYEDERPGILVRTLRALSGSVAAGLVVLTAVVIVVAIVGAQRGFPGPGAASIAVHVAGAVAALACQRISDRGRSVVASAGSALVLVIAGAVLWTQWWN